MSAPETDGYPAFADLVSVMARLRAPDGCPWDREQTHESLKPYLLEEAYEVLECIDHGDRHKELCAELGDVILQVVFHAQLAAEEGHFNVEDVCRAIVDKLVRRHPHVFANTKVAGSDHVVTNWEVIKRAEREEEGEGDAEVSALDGVPNQLPALQRAQRIQEKASRVGFDWPDAEGALAKVGEEVRELDRVQKSNAEGDVNEHVRDEFGDLLFSLVNSARFLRVDAEDGLRQATDKFSRRFREVERDFATRQQSMSQASIEELNEVWDRIKEAEIPRQR
ncbi:MAG: nucleoside triphosphate pyrophosphohydrolase [Candidatus Latescibacterota bacterium]|nr:nucleoside triphosphate pyrophosphohydrolase [Candidatus Latescibacterota bacterium]